jgi:hypothetical protein
MLIKELLAELLAIEIEKNNIEIRIDKKIANYKFDRFVFDVRQKDGNTLRKTFVNLEEIDEIIKQTTFIKLTIKINENSPNYSTYKFIVTE